MYTITTKNITMLFNVYASQQKIRTRRVFYSGNIINCSIYIFIHHNGSKWKKKQKNRQNRWQRIADAFVLIAMDCVHLGTRPMILKTAYTGSRPQGNRIFPHRKRAPSSAPLYILSLSLIHISEPTRPY